MLLAENQQLVSREKGLLDAAEKLCARSPWNSLSP
jgi:hypothetical protein